MPVPIASKMEDTQSKIVNSALEALAIKGFHKVTLNDIARLAKVSRPTVYSYFKDKDELIRFALLQSSLNIADDLIRHAEKFSSQKQSVPQDLDGHRQLLYQIQRDCSQHSHYPSQEVQDIAHIMDGLSFLQ